MKQTTAPSFAAGDGLKRKIEGGCMNSRTNVNFKNQRI